MRVGSLRSTCPLVELDHLQQLFSRLRALQVNRCLFLQLLDASQLSKESLQDEPIRGVWTVLANEWLAWIEQLPPATRSRLGRLNNGDWEQPRKALLKMAFIRMWWNTW